MRRSPLLVVSVLLGLAMTAENRSASAQQVTVDLTARQLPSPPDQDFARAVGAADRVKVEGAMTTPTPCYDLAGTLQREGDTLTLTVEARRQEGGCIQVIAGFGYDAAVRSLPPGRYTVRVRHAHPGTGWEGRTVSEEVVQVGS